MNWWMAMLMLLAPAGYADIIFLDGFESPSFSIGGTVHGLQGEGLVLLLEGHGTLAVTGNGQFTFTQTLPDTQAWSVSVEQHPTGPEQFCTVDNGEGVIDAMPVMDVVVVCSVASSPAPTSPGGGFEESIEFLYTGDDAPQSGVDPADIAPHRVSVLQGRVFDGDGVPMEGATLTILDHPEFGQVTSEWDGRYRLAVNGGGELVVDASAPGLLPSQRRVGVPWNSWVSVADMALVALDSAMTTVSSGSTGAQLAIGSTSTDARGSRTGRMLFPANTTFQMVMPGGGVTPLSNMDFRITEYTVGEMGPKRMPGVLPETSAYTYAMELSSDEALAAGAVSIELNQPAWYYLDNFLGFPTGEIVPNGYYDRRLGLWVPSDNGLIVEVTAIDGGVASLDVDGDGVADQGATLESLGIDAQELELMSTTFGVGESFWRIPVTHFSPHDPNWPFEYPPESEPPPEDEPEPEDPDPCQRSGSVIECPTRVLGEEIALAGSDLGLHYRTNRTPGFTRALKADITVTEDTLPVEVPVKTELIVEIAGQRYEYEYAPVTTGITESFTWDRTDAFGRVMQGRQTLVATTRHYYEVLYTGASQTTAQAFGAPGNGASLGGSGVLDYLETRSVQTLGLWDARGAGFGGWTLSLHHALDPAAGLIYEGNGNIRQLPVDTIDKLIENTPAIYHLSVSPDGSILANANSSNVMIKRFLPDGSEITIAGGGKLSCEVTPITFPDVSQFEGIRPTMAIEAPDGTVVFVETICNRISRVELDGSWSPVAGSADSSDYTGDGGPALDATMFIPRGLALGSDGAIYFSDSGNHAVRRIGPEGNIETIAGGNGYGYGGDGGLAVDALMAFPGYLAVGPDESVYVIDQGTQLGSAVTSTRGTRIRRITPDGTITTIAGDGSSGGVSSRPVESGVPATDTGIDAEAIVVSPQGEIYFNEIINHIIRRIGPDGIITTFAGIAESFGNDGDGGPATAARFFIPSGLALAPDGRLLVNDRGNSNIREIHPSGVRLDASGDYLVPGGDGREVYVFDTAGLQRSTVDALTGATLFSFEYDEQDRLARVDDLNGVYLDVSRPDDSTVIVTTQTGEANTLTLDDNGFLAAHSLPGGESRTLAHGESGLLARFGDFSGHDHEFGYDLLGLLERDENRLDQAAVLADNAGPGLDVTLTDVFGGESRFATVPDSAGGNEFERVSPYGGVTASVETADGMFSTTLEDGLEIDSQLAPDPRFGFKAPYESSRTVRTPGGLTLEANSEIQVTLNGGTLDLATLTATTAYDGNTFQSAWDAATREFITTSAEGLVTQSVYDVDGRLISRLEDPAFDPALISYDAEGRLEQVIRGSGVFTQEYDADGHMVGLGNNSGLDMSFSYDENGRLASSTTTSDATLTLGYTDDGELESLTLPSTNVHTFTYHPTGQLASYTAPGAAPLKFAAREDGSLAGMTLPGGRLATRTFDSGQRPSGWVTPESTILATYVTGTTHVETTTWTPTVGSAQALDLDYDGPLVTRLDWNGVSNAEVDIDYGDDFRIASTTLNSGSPRAVTRDGDGRLVGDGPFTWTRDNPRRAISSIADSTAVLQQTVNSLGLMATRTLTVNGNLVHELTLTYRADRRVDTVTESLDGTADDRSYVYDADNRLHNVKDADLVVEHYEYDSNLNRTMADLGTPVVQTYDNQDRLTALGAVNVTVDDDGQTTQVGSDSYAYSARGDLLNATVGGTAITFTYDGFGRRVARTVGSETTSYVYGNPERQFQVTAVHQPDGAWLEYYYDDADSLYAIESDGSWYYVASDHLGSPRVVADAAGVVVKIIDYNAFGEVLSDSNAGLELHIGFAGGLREPVSGLVRFGIRDYAPRLGRFMTRDPLLFLGGSINLYAYVLNDPVNLVDRNGLFPWPTVPAGSVSAGGYAGLGMHWELSSDGAGGYGFCYGVGVGAGVSVDIDPYGRPETSVGVDGQVGWKVPGVPVEGGVENGIKWVKCPPGSARPGYWDINPLTPGITAGPLSLGPEGFKYNDSLNAGDLGKKGLGGGFSSNANFTACAEI